MHKLKKLSEDDRYDLLELALVENKPDFVNLLLDNEVDLLNFLTLNRLNDLYNNEYVCKYKGRGIELHSH